MSIIPRASSSDDSRMIIKKPLSTKSLLLRDYLLDDMSSCSSNGFKSYPRHRQCCTTIRFLVEMDLNNKHNHKSLLPKNSNQHRHTMISKSKSNWKTNSKPKQPSMMERASSMMINAFKHFPFPSTKKSPMISLSRKLLKNGLWKKSTHNRNNEVKQLISLGDLLKKTDINCPTTSPSKFSITVFSFTELTCTNSNNNSNSNNWSGSDFTATTDSFATSNSSGVNKNDTADELLEGINGKGVSTTTTNADNADASEIAKDWQNEQDEQLSPVCVMDFPSDNDNDEDEVSSLFQHNHLEVEGTKNLMTKTRRFKDVPQIEPVKLENRIAQLAQEEDIVKQKALTLLQQIKSTFSSHHLLKSEVVESLLLAFFKERIGDNVYGYEMLQTAKDWMDGHLEEMPLDWESENNRRPYVRDMENVVKWSKYDDEVEKNKIVLELECEIFTSLVNDILLEFRL